MLQKLARQTAIYGVSTIVERFLSYLLAPFYTRVFGQAVYGVYTDVYSLIPLALVLLTMGMETSYFRFADKPGVDRQRLFATTWGVTSLVAALFFVTIFVFRGSVSGVMGPFYVVHPEYVVWVAAIVALDVWKAMPFCRLRQQGRAKTYVALRIFNVSVNVGLAFAFGWMGLYATPFGVGWAFVANFAASAATLIAVIVVTGERTLPRIDPKLLRTIFLYSLPLLISGVAGMANEFIDRQMIKYLAPAGAMEQVGVYGAIVKVGVVMLLFIQMYRYAAEPFFLADYKKSDFKAMNAAALQYFVLVSMVVFLGVALFKDVFALIVGRDFREGIGILPVVLFANFLSGVWLNLSFWYKREEKTHMAIIVTVAGLVASMAVYFALVPRYGYYGAAWGRMAAEAVMVAVSFWLNRRYYPIPYKLGRMAEYVGVAGAMYGVGVWADNYVVSGVLIVGYMYYAVKREKLDVCGLAKSLVRRG